MATHQEAEHVVKRGFVIHLAVYVIVVGGLVILNVSRNPHHLWSLWVVGGWGLGVAFHAFQLFVNPAGRECMISRTMNRLERREHRREHRRSAS